MYSDLARPPLRAADLNRALVVPGGLWQSVRVVAETGSTNADVAEAARAGAPEGLVVVAEQQTAGRGRLGRGWQAPARAALTFSALLRPDVPAARVGWLPLLAGVALAQAVGHLAGVETALKWPNDLLVRLADAPREAPGVTGGFGKCAGILAEGVADIEPTAGVAPRAVVLGIGLNVSQAAGELPPPIGGGFPPTSLLLAGAGVTDRDPLLRAVLRGLASWYERWRDEAGEPDASGLAEAYRQLCLTLGSTVAVRLPGGTEVAGIAEAVDDAGHLVLATESGRRVLAAGDVHHVR